MNYRFQARRIWEKYTPYDFKGRKAKDAPMFVHYDIAQVYGAQYIKIFPSIYDKDVFIDYLAQILQHQDEGDLDAFFAKGLKEYINPVHKYKGKEKVGDRINREKDQKESPS